MWYQRETGGKWEREMTEKDPKGSYWLLICSLAYVTPLDMGHLSAKILSANNSFGKIQIS